MKTTVQPAPNIIADLLCLYGIRTVVASPGTRNAPLIMAIAANESFRLISIVDERCAAFVALGVAETSDSPVALICTSGTALLNYAPAIAEAYYRNVPLIVISADRPLRLVNQDDGQTIEQPGALANIVRKTVDVPSDTDIRDFHRFTNRLVNEALTEATVGCRGPVHINVRLDSPLGEVCDSCDIAFRGRKVDLITPPPFLTYASVKEMSRRWVGKRIAVVVGTQSPDHRLSKALKKLSANPDAIVIYEAQSNIKGVDNALHAPDLTLTSLSEESKKSLYPELLVTVEGSVVSANLKQWLRDAPDSMEHWYVGFDSRKGFTDCYGHLSACIDVDAASFLASFSAALKLKSVNHTGYSSRWLDVQKAALAKLRDFTADCEWCDLVAVQNVIDNIGRRINLHISNGMSIRYAQLFDYMSIHRTDCNRGCSGIDGSTSTAIGTALASKLPTVLLSGDMSLDYDFNALRLPLRPRNFNLIVLNNGGGDIFRVINNTRHLPCLNSAIALPGNRNYKEIALALGFEYIKVKTPKELNVALKKIPAGNCFLEIDTQNSDNSEIYRNLISYIKCE